MYSSYNYTDSGTDSYHGCTHYYYLYIQDKVTPLFIASEKGHTTVVKLLLEAKAKPDLQNKVTFAVVACSAIVHLLCLVHWLVVLK